MSRHIFEEKLLFKKKEKEKEKKLFFRKGERERYFVTVLAFVWVGERTQVQLLDRGKKKKESRPRLTRQTAADSLSAAVFVYLTISFGWLLPTRRDEENKGNIRHKIYTRTN
jgi:hypothetical protein